MTAPNLTLHRDHHLGLTAARRAAQDWAAQAEQKFGMDCRYEEGAEQDTLHFSRVGAAGSLLVTASRFELQARLGFLLEAFKPQIEAEMIRQLDKLGGAPALDAA